LAKEGVYSKLKRCHTNNDRLKSIKTPKAPNKGPNARKNIKKIKRTK